MRIGRSLVVALLYGLLTLICSGQCLAGDNAKIVIEDTYVNKDAPPILTLHGDKDALVPIEQAKLLDEKMKAAAASHTLVVYQGQGHGFGGEYNKKAWDATWAFFDQHLKP